MDGFVNVRGHDDDVFHDHNWFAAPGTHVSIVSADGYGAVIVTHSEPVESVTVERASFTRNCCSGSDELHQFTCRVADDRICAHEDAARRIGADKAARDIAHGGVTV